MIKQVLYTEGVEKRVSQEEKLLITTIYGDFRYKISKIAMKFRLYKHPHTHITPNHNRKDMNFL